jgi:hypothetical protein
LLLICILLLFLCFSCVWIRRSGCRSTRQNRGDVGLGEQDSPANSPMLDAVMAHDSPERFGADLEHGCCGLGRINFHLEKTESVRVLTWGTTE